MINMNNNVYVHNKYVNTEKIQTFINSIVNNF